MAAKFEKGGDLMAFVGGAAIACATSHTFSVSAEAQAVSTKDAVGGGKWTANDYGILSWTCTSENLVAVGAANYTSLLETMTAREPVTIVFGKAVSDDDRKLGTTLMTGDAIITSLELNANNGENATMSVTFTGTGPVKMAE